MPSSLSGRSERLRQGLWWIFFWHSLRRHDCCWMACGTWITSVECNTCGLRWEDGDGIERMKLSDMPIFPF